VRAATKEIRGATKYLAKVGMIVTTKVTHGLVITICNYDYYQNWRNYEGHTDGHTKGTILRKKGIKKEKNSPDFSTLKSRYTDRALLEKTFTAIASTRRTNRVAESVLIAQLQKWEKYPVPQVEAGLKIYLNKDYASQGKKEEYLLGIIRNANSTDQQEGDQKTPSWF